MKFQVKASQMRNMIALCGMEVFGIINTQGFKNFMKADEAERTLNDQITLPDELFGDDDIITLTFLNDDAAREFETRFQKFIIQ